MSLLVVDAGPLIFLAKLGRLNLLRKMDDEIFLPSAVMTEIRAKSDKASSKIIRASKSWLKIKKVKNQEAVKLLLADLDLGEAEVIVLANEVKADRLLLDDLDARRFARRINLSIIGTLGVLLTAKLRGEIPSVKNEIIKLQSYGFWANDDLVSKILTAAGENTNE